MFYAPFFAQYAPTPTVMLKIVLARCVPPLHWRMVDKHITVRLTGHWRQ